MSRRALNQPIQLGLLQRRPDIRHLIIRRVYVGRPYKAWWVGGKDQAWESTQQSAQGGGHGQSCYGGLEFGEQVELGDHLFSRLVCRSSGGGRALGKLSSSRSADDHATAAG
jgi:hypothetical protein